MAYRFHRCRDLSRLLAGCLYPDLSRRKLTATFATSLLYQWQTKGDRMVEMKGYVRWSSTFLETQYNLVPEEEILSFIKSSFNELEGPNHRWLNKMDGNRESFDQDGFFLVLVNSYMDGSTLLDRRERIIMFETGKLLRQRYPRLKVFGLQYGIHVNSIATQTQIIQTVMEEYVTFPILISDKDFMKMTNGVCYLLFDGSTDHMIHYKLDVELGILLKGIEEFNILRKDNVLFPNSDCDRTKLHEPIKEPSFGTSFRNLFLYHPGCVSVDEDGERLFISDSNHHRIIITDGEGKILDCIGSSPGFEDGDFESAKVLRPAASFYDNAENCLYFVDSENNAIRRADMERRVLETVYPVCVRKTSGMWSWFLDKLGLAREVDTKREAFDLDSLSFPWHLVKLGENDLLVINRSFETSWIMSRATWEIKKVLRGNPSILEICAHMIMEKVSLLKNIEGSLPQQMLDQSFSLERVPYAGLMSSVAKFHHNICFCDSAGHRVLKCDGKSRSISVIQFKALGVLGLPYWLICPLERVSNSGYLCSPWNEHLHYRSVLPGRCDIHVNIVVPKGTELAAPLEEGCIWRQARGSAAELSGSEGAATHTEKVGVAQQWFDELDNLAFAKPETVSSLQDEESFIDRSFQDKEKVHFDCTVNISPGTSEVVVSMVLYLKLQDVGGGQELGARRILGLQKPGSRKAEDDACTRMLLESCGGDVRDLVFMKPVHLRIKLECGDHPPAVTTKETIIVDSTLDVNLSLE